MSDFKHSDIQLDDTIARKSQHNRHGIVAETARVLSIDQRMRGVGGVRESRQGGAMKRANTTKLPAMVVQLLNLQRFYLDAMGKTVSQIEQILHETANDCRRNQGQKEVKMK